MDPSAVAAGTVRPRHRPAARALPLALLVVALVLLAWSDAAHHMLLRLFEASNTLVAGHPALGIAVFLGLAALSAMMAFFSSAVLVPAAVFVWGPGFVVLLLWVGWTLGGIGSYSLARWVGRPALRLLAPGRSFQRYEGWLTTHSSFGLVLLLQLALPSEIPGVVLGLVRYPVGRYLVALLLVELPYAIGTVLLGQSFVQRRLAALAALGAVAAFGAALAVLALRHRLERSHGGAAPA